jgi:transposase
MSPTAPPRPTPPARPLIDRIYPGFAAVDIGAEKYFVATAGQKVRNFRTFTEDLRLLCAHLQEQGVQQVAMEATGVYWMPLYDALEKAGFAVTLFNGAHARNLPGRKSDVQDCEWHAMLHSHGLLQPCFVTPETLRPLRTYCRRREALVDQAAQHVLQMQRACVLANVHLHDVISQLHGVSGLKVVDAILQGVREPRLLADLCAPQILKRKEKDVLASLEGAWCEHLLFELRQAREAHQFCHRQIADCDARISAALAALNATRPPLPAAAPGEPAKKGKPMRHHKPQVADLYGQLNHFCGGRDAQQISGLNSHSWLKLTAELGEDLSAWATEKHFTSWAGLAPGRSQSGRRRRRVPRRKTRVGQIFREGAMGLAASKDCALGGFYRRLRGRYGAPVAIVATARKLAVLYWRIMTKGLAYAEAGLRKYEQQQKEQQERYLHRLAAKLGFSVAAMEAVAA